MRSRDPEVLGQLDVIIDVGASRRRQPLSQRSRPGRHPAACCCRDCSRGSLRRSLLPPARRWEAWERDVRQVVQAAADLSFLDACFFSGDELPGRDMSKIPHPLVTDTLQRLEGLEDR